MEMYSQTKNIPLLGLLVTTFPKGISEAFESLGKKLGTDRDYYGISWFDECENVIYYAMAAEVFLEEAKRFNYETLTVEKGEYLTETVHNWLSNTECIKDVFHQLTGDQRPDKAHPCIEWYKSDKEMMCMVRVR